MIIVIVVLVVGAGPGLFADFVLGRHKDQKMVQGIKSEELEEAETSLEGARFENTELSARNAATQAQIEGMNQQLAFARSQFAQAQQAKQIYIQQEHERAAAEAERRRQVSTQAAEAKRVEQEVRLKEQSKVLEALAPVAKNLDTLQNKVTQIEEGREREMGALGAQLRGLNDQQTRLDKETSSLSVALHSNKVHGAWDGAQLKGIVESAGSLERVDFGTQVMVTSADGCTLYPDMIVHLPGGKTIPIDAEVPYADYQRVCEIPDTTSPEDIARCDDLLRSHAKALREHVRALGEKAYWNVFDVTPDFVVAFIPDEVLLQATLEADPTLMNDAFSREAALTSPVTLWTVLKSVTYARQQQSLTDDAKQLFNLSRELYERFSTLDNYTIKLGTQITKTINAYNKFASSLEHRVLSTARKLQKIEPTKVIEEVPIIESDKGNVSGLSTPEVVPVDEGDAHLTASGDSLEL